MVKGLFYAIPHLHAESSSLLGASGGVQQLGDRGAGQGDLRSLEVGVWVDEGVLDVLCPDEHFPLGSLQGRERTGL